MFRGGYTNTAFAERIADYLVVDTYGDTEILGFEIKTSRADWLKELKDVSKAEAWRKPCNRWFLVVSDPSIVHNDLPEGWGLMTLRKDGNLAIKIQSHVNESPEPLSAQGFAQLLRSVSKTREKEIAHT